MFRALKNNQVWGQGAYGQSLHLALSFVVNLKVIE